MELQANFKFLNYELINRKNNEGQFLKLNILDEKLNPCNFLSFDENLINKIKSIQFKSLQDILIKFELVFSNNMWRVNLIDIILK